MPQILNNIVVKVKKPFEDIKEVQKALDLANKNLEGKGRVLLRYSGTENLVRVMVEGDDQDLVDKTCSELSAVVKRELA
jgi:phosphoglucosamine mutase